MKNIVLIPCWRRDDFLSVTLDHILKANGAEQNYYIFLADRGSSSGVMEVANNFPLAKEIRLNPPHPYHGNSCNVLEGYKFAASIAEHYESQLIYLIEEDIWIGKDFFDFHQKVQAKFDSYCLSAVRCQDDDKTHEYDPSSVYCHPTFQSLGISWRVDKVKEVAKHARPEYYGNNQEYIKSLAPHSKYGMQWTEQDGLIKRLVELSGSKCMFPYVPRAFHAGFVGYNRQGTPLTGSREERVKMLKQMSQQDMNDRATEYKDITSIDTDLDHKTMEFTLK